MMKPLSYFILLFLTVIAVGCTKPRTIVAPPPVQAPPKPPPSQKEPPAPAPVLAPEVGTEAQSREKRDAEAKIEGAEKIVEQIDKERLADEQQEIFATIQSFLSKARKALSIGDFPRAFNLAEKARILAEELLHVPR